MCSGGCDLVLLRNKGFKGGLGLNIHIRTKINTWWSYIASAVIQIGQETLEITGGENGGKAWINGDLVEGLSDGMSLTLSGFSIMVRQPTNKQTRYRIDLKDGNGVMMETYKDFVAVNVNVKGPKQFEGTLGLIGKFCL